MSFPKLTDQPHHMFLAQLPIPLVICFVSFTTAVVHEQPSWYMAVLHKSTWFGIKKKKHIQVRAEYLNHVSLADCMLGFTEVQVLQNEDVLDKNHAHTLTKILIVS